MAVRIVLFEDNNTLRESLATLLNSSGEFEVVYHDKDLLAAEAIVGEYRPEVVIMDIDMPEISGIEGVRTIKELDPEIDIIMYTQFEEDDKLFSSLCAGADGYILKKTSPIRLLDAIQEVRLGGAPMSPAIARRVLGSFKADRPVSPKEYSLTNRELEILQLLIKGYSIKQIASELFIAFDTCRTHLRNIYRKLHVNCGKEAIAKVLQEKIV
ncbi:response regulator [Flavihumibacter stibioxidans]|uniref:Two-component system response regulator n=1 Tax=Flavihumibacter stibioxidans TaxID=1834163 RepID=A0ABR7M9V8_9BACT|nr:response regulator transcription factor [Flavihumibacter stibioxidans]MBC6491363.1 two-component system response regulator [Flavihumibacter stibioxidans]